MAVHFSIPSDQIRRFGAEEGYVKDFLELVIFSNRSKKSFSFDIKINRKTVSENSHIEKV
jgi:hypothetical protein